MRSGAVALEVPVDVERRVCPERASGVERGGRADEPRVLVPLGEESAADVEEHVAAGNRPRPKVIANDRSDRVTWRGDGAFHGAEFWPVVIDVVELEVADLELHVGVVLALVIRL